MRLANTLSLDDANLDTHFVPVVRYFQALFQDQGAICFKVLFPGTLDYTDCSGLSDEDILVGSSVKMIDSREDAKNTVMTIQKVWGAYPSPNRIQIDFHSNVSWQEDQSEAMLETLRFHKALKLAFFRTLSTFYTNKCTFN